MAIANLQRILREQLEAARPVAPMETLREQARRAGAPPVLNPASDEPLSLEFSKASLRDILDALGASAGITVNFERTDRRRRPIAGIPSAARRRVVRLSVGTLA